MSLIRSLFYLPLAVRITLWIAVLALLAYRYWQPEFHQAHIDLDPAFTYQCPVNGSNSSEEFLIYSLNASTSIPLAEKMCNDPEIASRFGTVRLMWGKGEEAARQHALNGTATLIYSRPHLMPAPALDVFQYQPIATYATYKSYFIGSSEAPTLDADYLRSKKIGLNVSIDSRSGNRIPRQKLRQLGLKLEDLNITYVDGHTALRKLIQKGKVDIIASYWDEKDQSWTHRENAIEISSNIDGTAWYMKNNNLTNPIRCRVAKHLANAAQGATSEYFENIEPVACGEHNS